ncbi:MAG: Nif3-like dinuclear metal center hexameric protein, partial [Micrococcaceae bacterium]|nr:Nif3-like dinuclear metal center hexameric protein [Micrococcaceae bacterium]
MRNDQDKTPQDSPQGETTVTDDAPGRDEAVEATDGGARDARAAVAPGPRPGATVPTLGEVLVAIEELWPASLAEEWDAVGLVAGRVERPVRRIIFAVDPTLEVVRDA